MHRATLPHKILEVVAVGRERSASAFEAAILAPMATDDPGQIRYEHVLRNAPSRFWWMWPIAAVIAGVAALFATSLYIEIDLYWVDLRPVLASTIALGYAIYFFRSRPHTVSGTAVIRGGVLVDNSSGKPVVGRRTGSLSALSICSDPRMPFRLLAAGNFENGDELILSAPAEMLTPLRQTLDVPAGGAGWLTFSAAPWFPIAATLQWLVSLLFAGTTIAVFSNFETDKVLLIIPTELFALVVFSSMFLRTKPRPFLALGAGGIRAFFVTDSLGRVRNERILPWAAISQAETRRDRIEVVEARDGGYLRSAIYLPRLGAETRAVIDGQLRDAVRRAHGAVAVPTGNDALSVLAPQEGEPEEAWRARLEVAAVGRGGYRGADHDVEAWAQAVVDPDAPPKVRVAAGYLLTRIAPERIGEVSGILADLRDEEARSLARAVIPRLAGHRNDL